MKNTGTEKVKYALLMNDYEFGHPELGWIPRVPDADAEDFAYQRFLRRKGIEAKVYDGYAFVFTPIQN